MLDINDDHVNFCGVPFFRPQEASYVVPDFKVFELTVLVDVLERDQHTWEFLDAVHLALPDAQLLCDRPDTLLITQIEACADRQVNVFPVHYLVSYSLLSV